MAINYSITKMRNPRNEDAPPKYYAKAQASGAVDINELADEISYATTLTDGDVLNVIRALIQQINRHIAKGEIVRLENLGSFQAQLSSEGAETGEAFTEDNIRRVSLQFRPGVGIRGSLAKQNLKFRKVSPLRTTEEETVEDESGGEDGTV